MYNTLIILLSFFILSASFPTDAVARNWVIVIDAGHGGRDPGALGSLSKEKDITLPIALKTGEYIEKNMNNVKVLYTRKTDVAVDIRDRAEFANKNKADLFISIHVNWAKQKNIRGTETFVMGLTKDEQNLEVAMKENEVILREDDYTTKYEGFDPKSPESYIMFSVMQNVYLSQSTDLASRIQAQYKDRVNRVDRGVKQAGFWVLFMTTMPSVLTETGFITNLEEEKFLNSTQGQDYIASALFRACRDYIIELDKKSGEDLAVNKTSPSSETEKPVTQAVSDALDIAFMVQIATSGAQLEIKSENFKGLREVIELRSDERFKYATGRFNNYTEAVEHRKKIEALFPDAFVIAVQDNKILPLQKALDITKRN
jgi:N-acetylmuramoyl-L-alanine amidase